MVLVTITEFGKRAFADVTHVKMQSSRWALTHCDCPYVKSRDTHGAGGMRWRWRRSHAAARGMPWIVTDTVSSQRDREQTVPPNL